MKYYLPLTVQAWLCNVWLVDIRLNLGLWNNVASALWGSGGERSEPFPRPKCPVRMPTVRVGLDSERFRAGMVQMGALGVGYGGIWRAQVGASPICARSWHNDRGC